MNGTTGGAIGTIQFVDIAMHPTNANIAFGGTQDNGMVQFNDSLGWTTVEGGDVGAIVVHPTTPNTVYHVSPVGSYGAAHFVRKSTDGGATWTSITSGIVNAAGARFYPPMVGDPADGNRLYLGTTVINVTTDGGANWAQLGAAVPGGSSISAIGVGAASTTTIYAATSAATSSSLPTAAPPGTTAPRPAEPADLPTSPLTRWIPMLPMW